LNSHLELNSHLAGLVVFKDIAASHNLPKLITDFRQVRQCLWMQSDAPGLSGSRIETKEHGLTQHQQADLEFGPKELQSTHLNLMRQV
jgi:hypothetical protein